MHLESPDGEWREGHNPFKHSLVQSTYIEHLLHIRLKWKKRSSKSFPVWVPWNPKRCSVENEYPGYTGLENYRLEKFRQVSLVFLSLSHQRCL